MGERLRGIANPDDLVARIGGDEFGLLLCNLGINDLQTRLEQIAKTLIRPYQIDGLAMNVTAGIGLAICPDHGRDLGTLLRHADMAKGTAKEKHLPYVIYDGSQDRYSLLRLSLLTELQGAITRNQLVLQYQPKLNVVRQSVSEVEALVRWNHPVYGLIPPTEFIPMVEQTGNISLVTQWALHTAIDQATAWHDADMPIRVAINISAHDMRNPDFASELENMLATRQCIPSLLALEMTESAIMEDVDQTVIAFRRLRSLGLKVSIDDYGTGYSSMAQLKHLPVDELKIDQSFVTDMDRNRDDEIIVHSIIELGHNMGLKVTGEGVESRSSLLLLRKLQCDSVQGHYISRSLGAEQFQQWWQAREWRTTLAD